MISMTSLLNLFYRSVLLIDTQCQQINGKLHRLSAILPDVASLSSLDYDTSKRADPQVLQKLITHAKLLGVSIKLDLISNSISLIIYVIISHTSCMCKSKINSCFCRKISKNFTRVLLVAFSILKAI